MYEYINGMVYSSYVISFGICFIFIGISTLIIIKKHYSHFYIQYYKLLIFSTCGLAFPIIAKGIVALTGLSYGYLNHKDIGYYSS